MNEASGLTAFPAQGWVLVANAARARCLARAGHGEALREIADFVHPASRLKGQDLASDRGGKVRKSDTSTQYAPHTDPHDKTHVEFARELAAYLESAALSREFPALAILASAPFLGVLRAQLGSAALQLLHTSVPVDLSGCGDAELERRVAQALADARP